ncbi:MULTISPECIES: putative O-glycosylation ligase, exosortase A system-associated [Kordiimonas]|uniref:putative O-glycosylation ligase, exosortase A system-associated n=1 Tax=Kordiimonas TaxID=288021 RepID=UPI00257D59A1|nr:putative O-glycosylation ligase, exosortase A system-associated [Kordiimonas sp. UBA4487]
MRDIVVALIVLGWLPFAFFRPVVGILLWFWLSHMNPHAYTYGFAQYFGFLDYVALATMAGLVMDGRKKSLPTHPVVVLLILYFIWIVVTTIAAFDPGRAIEKFIHLFKILLFTFVAVMTMQTPNRLKGMLYVLMMSMAFIGLKGGFYTIATGGGGRVEGAGGMMGDNNQLAVAMAMSLPLALYFFQHPPKPFLKWPALGLALCFAISVVGTQSRGGFAALAAVSFMLLMKTKRKFTAIVVMAVLASGGYYFAPDSWKNRIESSEKTTEDSSFRGRVVMWKFSSNLADDNPIEGGGFDVFYVPRARELYMSPGERARAPHSIYFEVLGEHGYTGLVLWLTILFTGWYAGGTAAKRYRSYEHTRWLGDLCAACQLSLVAYAAGGLTVNIATFDYFHDLLAIIVLSFVIGDKLIARGDRLESKSEAGEKASPRTTSSKKWSPYQNGGGRNGQGRAARGLP